MLGEMLLARGHINETALVAGLSRHFSSGMRLGECLVTMGYIDEETMLKCVAEQTGLSFASAIPDRYLTDHCLRLMPYQDAVRLCVILGESQTGLVCFFNEGQDALLSFLDANGLYPKMTLAKKSVIRAAIDRAWKMQA